MLLRIASLQTVSIALFFSRLVTEVQNKQQIKSNETEPTDNVLTRASGQKIKAACRILLDCTSDKVADIVLTMSFQTYLTA